MKYKKDKTRKLLINFIFRNLFNTKFIFIFILYLFLIFSAFFLVLTRYQYKVLLDKEQKLYYEYESLQSQSTQILIEKSMLVSPSNLEEFAKKNYMYLPKAEEIKNIIPIK